MSITDNIDYAQIISTDCCFAVKSAARMVTVTYDYFLRESGITAPQFIILVALASKQYVSLTIMTLDLKMDRTTLCRNLTPLVKKSLIEETKARDLRSKQFKLTPLGHAAIKKAYPRWRTLQNELVNKVGNVRYSALLDELSYLTEKLSDCIVSY